MDMTTDNPENIRKCQLVARSLTVRIALFTLNIQGFATITMPKVPDRWLDYTKLGRTVAGTFVAFKTPLVRNIWFGYGWSTRRRSVGYRESPENPNLKFRS